MIHIGLTGWSDHPTVSPDSQRKLEGYAGHFPVVEMDTSFYAIPSEKNILSWLDKTPESFQFIPKAYATLTQHKKWHEEFNSVGGMFEIYREAFQPMIDQGRIKAFLFQFPPFFKCNDDSLSHLRLIKHHMGDLPVAIEFRHQSWFSEEFRDETLEFLEKMNFIHVVVDQPQTPGNSVPFTPVATNPEKTFIRLHGRNYEGWLGDNTKDWRKERTLYDYSEEELERLKETTLELAKDSKEVTVIFNNNSGGHAAPNAKTFQNLLGIEFEGLAPKQMDLFNN